MLNRKEEILLGLDYGEKRYGIAFGRNGLVTPIKVIETTNDMYAINEIIKLAFENKITKIIVGLPLTRDNKETKKSKSVRLFVKKLRVFFKKKIEFVSEYESTKDALQEKSSKGPIDHITAGIILKRYFDK